MQRLILYSRVTWASELGEAQRDLDIAMAAFHPASRRVQLGFSGHATIDLDGSRDDGGEVRWDASGGPAASVLLGAAALLLQAGAVSRYSRPHAGGRLRAAVALRLEIMFA